MNDHPINAHFDGGHIPTRPVLRYHGGKWVLAPWILQHLPLHRVYVEPFGGAGSVLLRKPLSRVEVLNDLNNRLVSAFRVLRDPIQSARLRKMLRYTPCASSEYLEARQIHPDPVEDARRLIVLGHQSHGSTGCTGGKLSGWRRGVRPNGPVSSDEWGAVWQQVDAWADRLRRVYLECANALDVIRRWDGPDTLHYVDPPYVAETRTTGPGAYGHDLTADDHIHLAEVLHGVQGMVVLSGYPSPLYDQDLYASWYRVERAGVADRNAARTEVLWLNPAAVAGQKQFGLFGQEPPAPATC